MGDSHDGSIGSDKTLDQLDEVELVPFKAAIEHDVPFVMVGHLSLPNVTGSDVPASLSPDIVTGVLRERLGYQNVVVTDSLGMGAVSAWCAPDQMCIRDSLLSDRRSCTNSAIVTDPMPWGSTATPLAR